MTRARDVADTQDNLGGAVPPFTAGKNKIINGDFAINQRNFTSSTANNGYGFDRFYMEYNVGTTTYSAQTFTPGTAPVAGYESQNFARLVTTGQTGSCYSVFGQKIEDVRTLVGQTITISFWAKAGSGTPKIGAGLTQIFGSGGSTLNLIVPFSTTTITTSWARYSFTMNVASISGKTLGANSNLAAYVILADNAVLGSGVGAQNNTFDIWGMQVEAGSVATPFTTATGTIQGELAACQRYYFRQVGEASFGNFGIAIAGATTGALGDMVLPVKMRAIPSSIDYAGIRLLDPGINAYTASSLAINTNFTNTQHLTFDLTMGSGVLSQGKSYFIQATLAGNYIGCSAEL
jgi:uncharacterized membrane protein YjjB (DUF3815 family)